MSRGRTRHHGSRRRAYSGRQREVRERRVRAAREDADWLVGNLETADLESAPESAHPAWSLGLQGRPAAA
jgi:hypothetical protein